MVLSDTSEAEMNFVGSVQKCESTRLTAASWEGKSRQRLRAACGHTREPTLKSAFWRWSTILDTTS